MYFVVKLSSKAEILTFCMSLHSKVKADPYYKRMWTLFKYVIYQAPDFI